MAGTVDRVLAEWLIIAFIAFALLFEIILHKLEHWVHARNAHLQSVLRNLYREIMILGVISFSFIMYIFIADPSNDLKFTFEVAHVWVFLFACFHTFIVSIAVFISLRLSKCWKSLERIDIVKYLECKASYLKLTEKRTSKKNFLWRRIGWWITNPADLFRYNKLHQIMNFHDVRYQFIYYRNLRPDFRFSKFLRKIKFCTFIELVEIHPMNWIILLALVGLDLIRNKVGNGRDFQAYFLMAHSVFNILLVYILARKIKNVYWKITKNPATYFDSIDPHAFRAELKIAEEEARINRKPRLSKKSRDVDRLSKDHGAGQHGKFVPVHQNMAFVPGGHGHGHDDGSNDIRYSLDVDKVQYGAKDAATSGSSGSGDLQHMGPTAMNLLEKAKLAHSDGEMSLKMGITIPEKDIHARAAPASDSPFAYNDEDLARLQHMSTQRRNLRIEALRRLRQRKRMNAGIIETARDVEGAANASPKKHYPGWLVKLFPRLGRVASATEKLFWFGSHRFYLFCVEFVLFYTNVNISTSISLVAFYFKKQAEYNKYASKGAATNVAKAAKFVIVESVRAAVKAKKAKPQAPTDNLILLLVALGMGVLALCFVLLKIAGIMKKYIFVLNNANLLPEDMMIETIQRINLNDVMGAETLNEGAEPLMPYDSGSDYDDDEMEGTDFRSMRRNMSTFLQKEHEGNV